MEPIVVADGKHIRLMKRDKWVYADRPGIMGIVAIVAITDDNQVLLVEQYRPAVDRRVIELPAGLVGDVPGEEHESLVSAARRELLEETGYEARDVWELAAGVPSAGMSSE